MNSKLKFQDKSKPDDENRQSLFPLERDPSWQDWELDRQMLRPPPLQSPRQPDLAYLNMTVDEAENEDGIEHYSLAKYEYMRTDAQIKVVREAQRDQRKVAGGINVKRRARRAFIFTS